MTLRAPLRRVLGAGSAREGVRHWWLQRLSAVALVPLTVWFLVSILALPSLDHATVAGWMHGSTTALLLILLVLTAAWHSQLGVRVVVEDYVPAPGVRTVTLTLLTGAHALLAAAGVFAVLRVALGAPA
ncbi:MAG TPA: succinate dehydrogenase, hydrophobic membrane anchor protein [Steroidobacteraceae bacterium]|nr:succinate dehydrogenase, hydrophobic membrane anchor protein [Steroidobacteraceae bacterium]